MISLEQQGEMVRALKAERDARFERAATPATYRAEIGGAPDYARSAQAMLASLNRRIREINERNYKPTGKALVRKPLEQERLELKRYMHGLDRGYQGDFEQWKRDRSIGRAPVPRNTPGFVERQRRRLNLRQGDLY